MAQYLVAIHHPDDFDPSQETQAVHDDITALKARSGRAIHGCIIGRALYDGELSAQAAIEAAA